MGKIKTPGEKLGEARREAGLSQGDLAEKSGVPVGTIRNLEQGLRTDPHVSTALALSDALETTVEAIWKPT
jgi:DNA-binding XRE family transcriptional regulator